MDSSRRSFDRSREPGLKKPRLTEELNARPLVPRTIGPVVNPVQPRFRASGADLESNDAIREAYQPQPLPLHQQHQELVEQYKTALAELTFNSKPIITNLTIIAGENLHAAKAIVATICSNILEVPSDQKLPSLYLLDSIVKNIGRDYIKYFAARLPEVFCKAYRQVDPSVHQSMIHLFGTWKGVFHPHTLQYIEREIGIVSSSNGSLGSTASRSDAQSQRPAHSIHVNPKYLVERQRLQQSSRAKVNEITGALANSEDVEGLDGASSVNAGHSWEDRPVKMHNIQHLHRDPLGEPVQEKNVPYANYDYGSQMPRSSALGSARAIGKVSEQGIGKPRYGAGGSVAHSSSSQRNGFSMKPGFPSYPPSKSANVDSHLQPSHGIASRSASGISSSWKNSEEEEFSWDSMEHRSIDRNVTNIPSISRKDHWVSGGSDEMGLKPNLANPSSKDVLIPAGTTNNLGHSEGYTVRVGGSPSRLSSFPRAKHLGPGFSTSSGSSGVTGSQRIQSLGSAPLSGRLLPYQHSPSHSDARLLHQPMENLVEQGAPSQIPPRSDFRSSKLSEMAIAGTHNQYIQEPLSKFRLKELKPSSALPLQNRNHPPFSQQPQSEPAVQEIVGQTKKQLLHEGSECEIAPTVGNFTSGRGSDPEYSEQLSQRNLSADNVEGGVVSGDGATSLSGSSFSDTRSKPSKVGIKPSLATRPSPTNLVSSGLEDAPLTAVVTHCKDKSIPLEASQGKVGRSPLQPGPRPAVMVDSAADQSSSAVETTANPVSSLLSSLILKGLISASKPEPTTSVPSQITMQVQNQGQDNAATGIGPDSSASVSTAIPASSAEDEGPIMEQVAKCSTALSQQSTGEIKNLIGFEFKPTVIREFNDSVISELFDDLPHRCKICGLQLKLQDHVDRHLAWHDSRNSESKRPSAGSRRWYADLPDWIAWTSNSTFESEYAGMEEKSDETTEMQGPMVPADESQCACILCGEPFDDIYNLERDEWMFKGAVYLDIQPANGKISDRSHSTLQGPIVHESCISESTLQDLGLANEIKLEKDA